MKTECIGVKCGKINCDKHKKQNRVRKDPRERDAITAEEYDLLTSRPHSKADLAYINADHASTSSDHDPFYSDDPDFDVSVKDMRKMDIACLDYFEKYGEKSEFNPDDVGVDYEKKATMLFNEEKS
jgi:hypothetical protein